ncbi:MAG: hypothetical protein KME64_13455 [Scytonematopsis contorta HA4267-MV1]|jgi:hypothetical protein|nr:hypothetical protein [Scytonematopsis contorta HA4267-MV1]
MTLTLALTEFLAAKFPGWGVCHFKFFPQTKTIYVHYSNPEKREAILRDAGAIANLDIGIDKFVVVHPVEVSPFHRYRTRYLEIPCK